MTHRGVDPLLLRPSGAILATQIALGSAIERCAVEGLGQDPTIIDLLVRLDLAPERQLRAVEICRQLLLSPSHISRVIDRAENAGLLGRKPDPSDRRASLVEITDAGLRLVDRFAPRLHTVLDHSIHQTLTPAEIDTLVDLLERIETAARTCPVGAR